MSTTISPSPNSILPIPPSAPPPSAIPLKFGVLAFPGFQALDIFGPLDALNSLSLLYPQLELYIIAETLEPVSTRVNSTLFNTDGPDNTSNRWPFAESIVPTNTFASPPEGGLDVLIVPGGLGTRFTAISGPCIEYINSVYPSLKYLLTVCTGSLLVACCPDIIVKGQVEKVRMTTNKRALSALEPRISSFSPSAQDLIKNHVEWVGKARWVVHQNIWSSSGVSAGLDMTFAFMKHICGEDVAKLIADYLEYERHEDPSWDPYADLYGLA